MRFPRLFASVVLCLSAAVAHATIATGLQLQLGNPSLASADPANTANFLLDRAEMALSYNNGTRDPNWVSWDLTNADVGSVSRSNFLPDPDLPAGYHAVTTDEYNGVGAVHIDRGHMSPSKDRTDTAEHNQVVFYMTNIVPQASDNNQGPWENFETECRNLAGQGNELLIVSGPSGFSSATIPSGVAFVPSFTWKVVVVVPGGTGSAVSRITAATRVIAIKIPNVNGIRSVPWTDYITSAAEIEGDTGYNLFRDLDPSIAAALRVKIDPGATTPAGAPTILTQPSSQTAVLGGSATFSVAATGATGYQWEKDGDEVNGATGPTLALSSVQATDAGNYRVTVSNASGSVISDFAALTISTPVPAAIVQDPSNVTTVAGANASFTVGVSGMPTPAVQWFRNGDFGTPVGGGATLTLTNVQVASPDDFYQAVATNTVGSTVIGTATSAPATLHVTPIPPSITTQPAPQGVTPGSNVTLSVVAAGSTPLSYQWRKNGVAIATATASTLSLSNVQAADTGSYDVVVSNGAGSTTSTLATIVLLPPGTGDISWDFSTTAASNTGITGVTPSVFSFGNSFGSNNNPLGSSTPSDGKMGNNNYGVPARTGALAQTGATPSAYFQVTFTPPAGQAVIFTQLTFLSRSTPTGPQAYSVFSSADNFTTALGTGTIPNNSNWNAYTVALPSVASSTPLTFRIFGHSGTGNASSGTVNWKIDDVHFFGYTNAGGAVQPTVAVTATSPAANAANVAVNAPVTVTFNTGVTPGAGAFTLNSQLHGTVPVTVAPASGTTFTLTPAAAFDNSDTITGTVVAAQLSATGQPGVTLSSNYTWTFRTVAPTPPGITTQPRALTQALVGDSVTLAVVATGTPPLSYQWFKGPLNAGALIGGATNSALTLSGLTVGDTGDYYVVIDNAAAGTLTSNLAHLEVTLTPVPVGIDTPPVAQTVASGGTATFTVVASGSAPFTYQWFKDGNPIASATSATLTLANVTPASAGNYSVTVSNSAPSSASAAATLAIRSSAGLSMRDFSGGYYQESFDSLPASGTFTFSSSGPFGLDNATANNGVGATALTGWSFDAVGTPRFSPDSGTGTSGSVFSYGTSSDRALGLLASGSNVSKVGLVLVNRTGATISQFSVHFVGEQWRHGGTANPNTLAFSYAVGVDSISAADANFTAASALSFTGPIVVGNAGALNGNATANRTPVLAQISGITWAPNQTLVLRWSDKDDTGTDDGLAVDDFVFTTDTLALPVITQSPAAQNVTAFTPATFSVVASGVPAITSYQWLKNGVAINGATSSTFTIASAVAADAGDYACVVTNLAGSVTSGIGSLTTTKASTSVVLGNLAATYDGTAHAASATTTPGGLNVSLTYNDLTAAPVNAGSYLVVATINDANYAGTASDTLVIAKANATVTFGGLAQTYTGSPLAVTTSTSPAGLAVDVAITGTPVNAGPYPVTATINDANYTGSASDTLVIAKALAGVSLSNLNATYDGTPKAATATTAPAGLNVKLTYDGSTTAPSNAGSYAVEATIQDANRIGTASGTLVIAPGSATVTLGTLTLPYDGTPRVVTATTAPAGLTVNVTYDGSATPPVYPGSYAVVATISDANYSGSASGTLQVGTTVVVRHAPSLQGELYGSLQVLLPESFTLNGGALVASDLLVPGTPTLRLNGNPTFAGTRDATGAATPTNYQVTLNGNAVLRYLVRHVDAATLPTVSAPPAPTGTRNVSLNSGQSAAAIGDFATVRNLTLNGNAGQVAVPGGTYGSLSANGNGGFTLGDASSDTPTVYNLQGLTLNGNAELRVVGPVIINLASGPSLNGAVNASGDAADLTINVANGSLTLNGNVTMHGSVNAPNGTVTINGNSTLVGRVTADRLTLNGSGELRAP